MKVFGRVVFAFLVSIFLAIALPSLSLSAYQWEPCGTGSPPVNQCVTKGVADGLTETYQCHKSAISGNWQWDKQTLLQTGGSESIESNKIIPGICSDGFNNNCNGITVRKPAGVYDSPLSNSIDYDTNDCVAPTTSITSVASDTSAPYYDTNGGDSKTDIVVSGESGMACKWDTTSHDYSDDFGTLCTPSGSSATCSVNDANTEDAKTRYVACKDSNANVQSLSDPATSRYPITVNWINDWSGPAITFDANNPKDPTGVPYDIKFKVKDLYSGVKDHAEADDITLEIKKGAGVYYSLTYTLPGFCNNAGEECSITKTINSGDAEAADGTYTIKVTAKDKLGNVNSATRSFSVSTCKLDSVSIAPSTACTKNLNSCSISNPGDNACEKGNAIDVTARYTGLSCPTTFTVQVDAKSAEIPVASCNVQGSGGQMTGISITCSNTPSASQQTCTGTWTLPDPIPSACQQETITAKSGSSDACINGIYCTAPSGPFGSCKDTTPPVITFDASNPGTVSSSPFNIRFTVSDAHPGVDSLNGGITLTLDNVVQTYTLLSTCDTPGSVCSIKKDNVNSADGAHAITVTATDKQGNSKTETKTFTVSTCTLNSIEITPGPACNSALNDCVSSGSACDKGETFAIEAKYAGVECPASFNVQTDAKSADNSCTIQGSNGDMQGMLISCANADPAVAERTCTGTWTLPSLVHSDCQQKTVLPSAACIKKQSGSDICIFSGFSGSPGMCRDTADTIIHSISLQGGAACVSSRTMQAAISATDSIYGLNSCTLNWGDGSSTTKTCAATLGTDCAGQFSAAEKQHAYASDETKTAAFSCTNVNGITDTTSDSIIVDTTTPDIAGVNAYTDNTRSSAISDGIWQKDIDPYFEWATATSLCGVKYYVTTDGTAPTASSTERTVNNYMHPTAFSNAKYQIKVNSINDAGTSGTVRTFNLWVDTSAPTTSIVEAIPAWFTVAPTLHLSCSDNPVAPADNSGCSSTQYCLTTDCTPSTTYTTTGITISSSATLSYRSSDVAGNVESTKSQPVQVDTTAPNVNNLKAYTDSAKLTAISDGAWQKDTDPYFVWDAISAPSGVTYYLTTDGTTPVETSTSTTDNFKNALTFGNGKSVVKIKAKTGAGVWGSTATFNLWVDINAPTTSINELIPAWFTSAPTLHLSCSDNPAAPADNSGCGTVQFCTGSLCTPNTNYNPVTGVPNTLYTSSSTVLGYRSADSAGNTETEKYTTINVDATAPSVVSVTDSGAFTKSTAALTAAWTVSVDAESGISLYQYAVGTTSGGTDVIGFTDTGATTTATISGLSLINGNTYYITIRAKNGAGLFGTPASSDGIKVDTDGPGGVETIKIERTFGNYISGTYAIFTDAISDTAGVDTTTCSYTIDDAIWPPAAWNTTDKSCKKVGLSCTDGQQIKVKMRISDVLGTTSQTSASVIKTCDTTWPELQSFVPAAGTTLSTALKDLTFSTTARDLKSGLAKLEWTLFKNDVAVNTIQKACDGGESVSVTCDFKTSEFVDPGTVKTGDKFFVRVRGDDHIDPWSPTGDSGQWSVDETAPAISAITPTLATLSVQQDYSAGVKATSGRTISSCDLLVNGAKIDDMALTSGTGADGTWTGQYTITAPSTIFMRAHCVDDSAVAGDGLDVQISLATATTSVVAPSVVEKLQIASITANYKLTTGTAITGAKCWISSSDFNDPSKGIVGVTLTDLNNGYYTYSFAAPAISGNYNYAVSCAKPGYQTTSNSNMFTVQGCNGMVCIKVTPSNTVAILTLGEPQAINLILKNRDDFTRTYSVSLSNPDPKIFVDISPTQVTLANGEQKAVTVRLTSLAITDQQIVQNIIVKNIDPSKPSDIATSVINAAIAVSAVPGIGAVEVAAIFVLAAVIVYNRTGRKVKRKR